ncbi:MAG TPA: hypothetical protein VFH27_07810 [Longimicrobiaceae bacterium]|nr:hypothetical protein [Longimicrobiaceae bacterium]
MTTMWMRVAHAVGGLLLLSAGAAAAQARPPGPVRESTRGIYLHLHVPAAPPRVGEGLDAQAFLVNRRTEGAYRFYFGCLRAARLSSTAPIVPLPPPPPPDPSVLSLQNVVCLGSVQMTLQPGDSMEVGHGHWAPLARAGAFTVTASWESLGFAPVVRRVKVRSPLTISTTATR